MWYTQRIDTGVNKMTENKSPSKVEVYLAIVEYMKKDCLPETIKKLDNLKEEIFKGYNSPSTASISIFGVNLFIYKYDVYLDLYNFIMDVKIA